MASQTAARQARTLLVTSAVAAGGLGLLALPAQAVGEVARPDTFTSAFTVQATTEQVVTPDGGAGPTGSAKATFSLQLNSELDVLCYSILTTGVAPPYMSMARTSTHIHEASAGQSGPARVVFPDPSSAENSDPRRSSGCLQGPFITGLTGDDGADTGAGFTVAELEADPSAYYVDIHTAQFVPGAVRGQVSGAPAAAAPPPAAPPPAAPAPAQPPAATPPTGAPSGGVAAGFGGLSDASSALPASAALATALLVLAGGLTGSAWLRGRAVPAGRSER